MSLRLFYFAIFVSPGIDLSDQKFMWSSITLILFTDDDPNSWESCVLALQVAGFECFGPE